MRFEPAQLPGVWVIHPERRTDERGFFMRAYCEQEFAAHGLNTRWPQTNLSLTRRLGTIRGLHFQLEPRQEVKLVRCLTGKIFDVLVDLRPDSPAFGKWEAFTLSAENGHALYIPGGFAHGFQSQTPEVQIHYQVSDFYAPALERGVRWNDPELAIPWPLPEPLLSERDRQLPLFRACVSS